MRLRPTQIISIFFTAFIIFLSIPATAILASWNSVPGSTLYPVKIGLEKMALALLPNSFFEVEFRLKLIDRRTQETVATITKSPNNNQALQAILAEAQAAQLVTVNLPTSQKKSQTASNLISKLNQTNRSLEQIKPSPLAPTKTSPVKSQPTLIQPPALPPTPTTPALPIPTPIAVPTPTSAPAETSEQPLTITETQEVIEKIIVELEQEIETTDNSDEEEAEEDQEDRSDQAPGNSGEHRQDDDRNPNRN